MGILGELWIKLGLKNDGLNKGVRDSENKVSRFAQGLKKLGGVISAAFAAEKVIAFSKKCAELANQIAGVKKAFDRISDPNLLKDLRRATQGTITDLQLMQRAVQANNFKIPLDQLATYLEFATKRARETGQSVDYLVDSIVTGLGRQSILILDNLGISAKEIRDNMKDGATMAEAVGKIIQKEMKGATTEINNAEVASARLSASWQNFMTAIGSNTGVKNVWNSVLGWMADKFTKATEVMELESVGTGLKILNILSGGVIGGALFDELIKKQEIANTPDGPEIPEGVKIIRNDGSQTQEETESVKGLINQLEAEIKAKTELRNLSIDTKEIARLNEEIKSLEKKLRLLREVTDVELPELPKIDTTFDNFSLKRNIDEAAKIMDSAVDNWQAKGREMVEVSMQQQAMLSDAAKMITSSLVAGVGGSLNELANVIAGVENANVGSVVSALLSPLADACISAGLLIIATGDGIEALRTSLMTFLGVGAIAAGGALVAIGMAAKVGLAAIGKTGKAGTSSVNQSVNSYSGGYGIANSHFSQSNDLVLSTTLKGQDILLSVERTQRNNKR